MAKVPSTFELHGRRAILLLALAAAMAPLLRAFKIGAAGFAPIHENITSAAMLAVVPQADPMFVINVQSGVYNPDISHHFSSEFHFDDSTAGDGSGGFTNGFVRIDDMLNRAQSEATVCDLNGVCGVNPLFLNPQHSNFRDLAKDIVDTYSSLSLNSGCLNEPACPSADFGAGAAFIETEVVLMLLDTDPDPDEVTAFTIAGLNINVPNFAPGLAAVKSNLDALLGRHCRPSWLGGMCFDSLELMAPGDNDFQLLAGHLRILQYEYQAYYAWQHLGHAFHTTQDFFAHSNYVELAAGRTGPQCDPNSYQAATICDAPLDITKSGPWTAIRLPSDGAGFMTSLVDFRSVFSTQSMQVTLNGLPSIFGAGTKNFDHLQTGYYPCGGDPDGVGTAPQGFPYCHTSTQSWHPGSAGLNKDMPYQPGDELNHQNWGWAAVSAQRMSVVLFEAFMTDLLGAASGNYISASSAVAGSQRVGEMAWLSSGATTGKVGNLVSPWQLGPGGRSAAGLTTNITGIQLARQLSASVCPTVDGKSCALIAAGPPNSREMDIVTVTSGGAAVPGATVSVSGQPTPTFTVVTNAHGVALITHVPCYSSGTQIPAPGRSLPVPLLVPCVATVSMAGYQPASITLP
ncbi:MAG: hypothetical protein DMG38_23235 [Acidobacteria bacterium]|nr:MAG: hypothetical protein DMG38_23235 [Acidobacteriota bacterium]